MSGAHSKASRQKQSQTRKGSTLSENHKENISKGMKNSEKFQTYIKNPVRIEKFKLKRKGVQFSENHKINMSKNHADISGDKNPSKREDVKLKIRLKIIERLQGLYSKNGKFKPGFNKNACDYFEELMKKENCFIQHALNLGEFYIQDLGYWIDGYDADNNTVYEFDERRHFDVHGNLKEKDKIRQTLIENYLGCKFIRIKWNEINL